MNKNHKVVPDDEISIKEVILKAGYGVRYLGSKWLFILLAACLGAVFGFYKNYSEKTMYTAECTFVMEGGQPAPAASGFASIIGIDLGSSSGLFQAQNVLALYKTRLMVEKTLFTPVDVKVGSQLLIDRYVQLANMGDNWSAIPEVSKSLTLKTIVNDVIKNRLTVESGELVKITVTAEDELFAKMFAETLVENVNSFYIDTKTRKGNEALVILQRQADSLRRVLNISMSGAAAAIDANPNANQALQVLRVPSQRRQIDVQASSAIYTDVVRNLENTRMSLRKETPLIQIVDRPTLPLDKSESNSVKSAIIWSAVFSFLTIVIFLIYLLYSNIMKSDLQTRSIE